MKRGQAALEFLFTYGWAIFAITLSIGVLSYFNVLTPDKFVNKYCDLGAQFECIEGGVYENGTVILYIRNNNQVDIELTNITLLGPNYEISEDLDILIGRGNVSAVSVDTNQALLSGQSHRIRIESYYKRVGAVNNYMFTGALFTTVIR